MDGGASNRRPTPRRTVHALLRKHIGRRTLPGARSAQARGDHMGARCLRNVSAPCQHAGGHSCPGGRRDSGQHRPQRSARSRGAAARRGLAIHLARLATVAEGVILGLRSSRRGRDGRGRLLLVAAPTSGATDAIRTPAAAPRRAGGRLVTSRPPDHRRRHAMATPAIAAATTATTRTAAPGGTFKVDGGVAGPAAGPPATASRCPSP